MLRVALDLAGDHDFDLILDRVVVGAAEVTGARYAALGVYDQAGRIERFVHHGLDAGTVERIGALPQGRGRSARWVSPVPLLGGGQQHRFEGRRRERGQDHREPFVLFVEEAHRASPGDVLRLVALSHTNADIAEELYVSVRTVETHRAHVQQKLGVKARADLVRVASEHGLITDDISI